MKHAAHRPADLSMMPIIHDAFRRDLRRLARLAKDPEARPAARALWSLLLQQLAHHHTSEDERLWPLVRDKARAASDHAVLDAMEQEHAALEEAIERVTRVLDDPGSDPEEVRPAVESVRNQLEEHLAHEERDAVPLVERLLTHAELRAFERHQKKTMGLGGAATFFPWLLDDLDEQRRAFVLKQLPQPLRLLAETSWQRRYATESRAWRRVI